MTRDRITGVLSVILGVAVAIYAWFLPASGMEGDIGPAVFPYIAAGMLIICGLILMVTGKEKPEPFFKDSQQIKRFLLITFVYIVYGVLLWAVGFLIATPVICFILCQMMGGAKKDWWKQVLFSLVVTAAVYYCFFTVLSLKLPVGRFIRFMI